MLQSKPEKLQQTRYNAPLCGRFATQAARAGSLQLRQEIVDVGAMLDQVMRTTVPMAKRSIVLEKVCVCVHLWLSAQLCWRR